RVELGKEPLDDRELHGEAKTNRWAPREEQLVELAPDSFGGQIVERNRSAHRSGLVVDVELESSGELHGAEDAKAVVGERRRVDHAKTPSLDIAAPVERVEVLM